MLPRVRPASPFDALIIARHRYPSLTPDDPAVPPYAHWVKGVLTRGVYFGWLAEADGAVVGGAGLVLLDWGPTRDDPLGIRGRVVNVFTDPAWRRRGLARVLVRQALNAADARGVRVLTLGTTPEARALYASLGFEADSHEMRRRS